MLELFSEESCIFHLVGPTSMGKTTNLFVAGSVWGGGGRNGFVETWRSTANALEATASVHNDGFLPLDELSEADARDIGQVVYMIGNNSGKARMSQHAKLTKRIDWRVVVLSSGERGLEELKQLAGAPIEPWPLRLLPWPVVVRRGVEQGAGDLQGVALGAGPAGQHRPAGVDADQHATLLPIGYRNCINSF